MRAARIRSPRLAWLGVLAAAGLVAAAAAEVPFPGWEELRARAETLWTGENPAQGAYLVLVPERSPLLPAARLLARHRSGEIVSFSPSEPEALLETLIRRKARYAAIFVPPEEMDVNLLRRFIVLSTLLDADPFCDVALGFVTASTPERTTAFVKRMVAADRAGVKPYAIQWCTSNISQRYEGSSFLVGIPGESYYVATGDLKYARQTLPELQRAGFIHIGGCGDPEGIWLFDDERNLDRSKHWPFDPAKVGQDPEGEMPRVLAPEFGKVRLHNAVVWTHVCHIGSVSRMFVEGDIVSTFGYSERIQDYRIPPGRSVALAVIDAGAAAYIAPLGPNFGAQSDIEQSIASETGAPLGDVLRRAYHDVVLDTGGHPEQIGLYEAGRPRREEPDGFVNHNSPHHRCLYGDPLLTPFGDHRSPPTVTWKATPGSGKEDTLALTFRVEASGWLGRTWYGNRGRGEPGRGRIYEVIPVEEVGARRPAVEVLSAQREGGESFSVERTTALVERIDGRTFLHLQLVTTDPEALRAAGSTVAVRVHLDREAPEPSPPPEPGSPVEKALSTPWFLRKQEWPLGRFLDFVQSYLAEHGPERGWGTVTFDLSEAPAGVRTRTVVVEADRTPLREVLGSICSQLDLAYRVDPEKGTVILTAKDAPGKAPEPPRDDAPGEDRDQ